MYGFAKVSGYLGQQILSKICILVAFTVLQSRHWSLSCYLVPLEFIVSSTVSLMITWAVALYITWSASTSTVYSCLGSYCAFLALGSSLLCFFEESKKSINYWWNLVTKLAFLRKHVTALLCYHCHAHFTYTYCYTVYIIWFMHKATTNWIIVSRPPPACPSWARLIFLLLW